MSPCPSCLCQVRAVRIGADFDPIGRPVPTRIVAECPKCSRVYDDRDPLPRPNAFPTPPPAQQGMLPGMPPDSRRFD